MKTISQHWKNGWQAIKEAMGFESKDSDSMSAYNDLADRQAFTGSFPALNEPPKQYTVQAYIDPQGRTRVHYTDHVYAVGSNGDWNPMHEDAFEGRDDFKQCEHCKLYVYENDEAQKKHRWIHAESERHGTSLEIRAVRNRYGNPSLDDEGRILFYFGAYKDIPTGKAVKTEDGYKEIYRTEQVMLEELKGPAANTDINGACTCRSCDMQRVNVTKESMNDVIISAPAELDNIFGLRATEEIKDNDPVETPMIRFAKPVSFGGVLGKFFEVEFRGRLTLFDLVDGDQGELETINRFTCPKSDQTSAHRIYTTNNKIIWLDVDWQGRVIGACTDKQTHNNDEATDRETSGYVDEFFIPANHTFFRHVNIQTVMKGLI